MATKKDRFAIIRTGGKQYRVETDDVIDVELLGTEVGNKVTFDEVLFIGEGSSPKIGDPIVKGASVKGEIIDESAGPKVSSMKYKPRQRQIRRFGHRQHYSRVKITDITVGRGAKKKDGTQERAGVES